MYDFLWGVRLSGCQGVSPDTFTSRGFVVSSTMYDFLREKSEFRARTLRSAEHALAFSETWSNTIIDFLMKINNL
jgi:hypothetical protein